MYGMEYIILYGDFMNLNAIHYEEDICPVTEFRAEINSMIQQTKSTHRPIVLTQHGKASVVVLDVLDFQRMKEKAELTEDIRIAQRQILEKNVYTTAQAKARVLKSIKNG